MGISENIEKLLRATEERKIFWEGYNPTTYIWSKDSITGDKINVIIQDKGFGDKSNILFRIFNFNSQKPILDIESEQSSEEMKFLLERLYLAVNSHDTGSNEILDDLLRDV